MKAKVLVSFYDKEAKKIRKEGDIFDVTAKRFNEIIAKGKYIQLVEETASAKV